MSRKIERTFTVSVSIEQAWSAMTDPDELNQWYFPIEVADDGSLTTEILGEQRTGEVVELEPMHKLCTRTTMTGHEGWGVKPGPRDMTIVLEATDAGTQIVITHSGFGESEDWDQDLAAVSHGLEESIADLVLYLETGVAFPRHHRGEKSFTGIAANKLLAGLQVSAVQPQTFADRLGLTPGDLLVELGGVAVFGYAELQFFTKEHAIGEKADAAWIRDGRLMRGTAELGPRLPVGATVS